MIRYALCNEALRHMHWADACALIADAGYAGVELAPFTFASHRYIDFHLLMPLFVCRVWKGSPLPREGQERAAQGGFIGLQPVRVMDGPSFLIQHPDLGPVYEQRSIFYQDLFSGERGRPLDLHRLLRIVRGEKYDNFSPSGRPPPNQPTRGSGDSNSISDLVHQDMVSPEEIGISLQYGFHGVRGDQVMVGNGCLEEQYQGDEQEPFQGSFNRTGFSPGGSSGFRGTWRAS